VGASTTRMCQDHPIHQANCPRQKPGEFAHDGTSRFWVQDNIPCSSRWCTRAWHQLFELSTVRKWKCVSLCNPFVKCTLAPY